MSLLKRLVQGYLVGLANIIPGVSGGTMALVLGIYPRLLAALGNVDADAVRTVARIVTLRPGAARELRDLWHRVDAGFLILLGIGAVTAILSLSRLMTFLLHQHLTTTYAFFFGLILTSLIYPFRLLRRRGWVQAIVCLVAAVATVAMTLSVDEDRAMNKAIHKASLQADAPAGAGLPADEAADGLLRVRLAWPSAYDAARIFAGAALAIAAMILPGVSGSFVMLLMGIYFDVLRAVNQRDLVLLAIFMVGGLTGLLTLSRGVSACLRRWFDATMAFMIGLMMGSLWGLWPFKRYVIIGDELIIMGNRWPDVMTEIIPAAAAFVFAVLVVFGCLALERRFGADPVNPEFSDR